MGKPRRFGNVVKAHSLKRDAARLTSVADVTQNHANTRVRTHHWLIGFRRRGSPTVPRLATGFFPTPAVRGGYCANQKWVADITYLWTGEGWLYLAVVLDLYSRAVVGWSMSERITRELVIAALTMAVFRRCPAPGLILHSDRGSQYAALDYQSLLDQHGFLCSMSKKGDCYDHAAMESFFHTLKVEQVHGVRYQTREEARADVFEYIETYYNRKRRHSTLNYQSPWDFENRMAA